MDLGDSSRSINLSTITYHIGQRQLYQQQIRIDMNQVPIKEQNNSDVSPKMNDSLEEINSRPKPVRKSRVNTNILPINQPENQRGSRILRILQKNKLIADFRDKLYKKAYIYPKNQKILNNIQEQYTQNSQYGKLEINEMQHKKPQKFRVLHPQSKIILLNEIVKLIGIVIILWWIPFRIAFDQTSNIEPLFICFTIIDILINLNKSQIYQGIIVKDRVKIFWYYFKYKFAFDLLYFITLILIFFGSKNNIYLYYEISGIYQFIANMIQLKTLLNQHQETFPTQSKIAGFVSLFQLIIIIIYSAHFMACVWYYVGKESQNHYPISWITQLHIQDLSVLQSYCYSFYWATTTMVTVGYGDISAQNIHEIVCAIVMMFFASGMFAFSINSIGMILTNIDIQDQKYKRTLLQINQYMQSNQVTSELQSRIRNYLKYYYAQESNGDQTQILQIMSTLSLTLKRQLLHDVQMRVVQSIKLFTANFSSLKEIACNLQYQHYIPREPLFTQNIIDDCAMYIVQKGEIHIVDESSGRILATRTKGQYFGELEFLTQSRRACSAYSNTFSQVYKIPREKFIEIIHSSSDYRVFCQMKDDVFLKQSTQIHCYACEGNHTIWDCEYLHYKPDLESIVKKQLFETNQERQPFKRMEEKQETLINLEQQQAMPQGSNLMTDEIAEVDEDVGSDASDYDSDSQGNAESPVIPQIKRKSQWVQEQELPKLSESSKLNSTKINPQETRRWSQLSGQKKLSFERLSKIGLVNTICQKQQSVRFSILDEFDNQQFQNCDIDKLDKQMDYHPQNNYLRVIGNHEKYIADTKMYRIVMQPNKYRFLKIIKIQYPKINRKNKSPFSSNHINFKETQ